MKLPGLNLRMVRHLVALSGGELFGKLVGFVAFAYLARTLDLAAFGAVELAVSLSLFFAMIVDFGLTPIGAREISRDRQRVKELAGQIPTIRLLIALLAVPSMWAIALLTGQPTEGVQLALLFSLGLFAIPFRQLWLLQGLEMMEWASLAQALRMSVFAIGVICLVRSADDLLWVGAVEVGAALSLAVYFLILQNRRITPFRPSLNLASLRKLLNEGLSVGLSDLVWALNQYLPTVLIAFLLGSIEVAFFGSAHRVVLSLATFSWLYHFNLFPAVSRCLAESAEAYQKLVRPSFKATAWGGIGVALVITLLAEPICRLVYGDAFAVAAPTLAVLIWTVPLTLLSGHARCALIAQGEQRFVLVAQVAGAVMMLGAGWLVIAKWGALGGAIAMVSSSAVVWFVAHERACQRVARIPFLAATARPVVAALGVGLVARHFDGSVWIGAGGAALAFALLGPLLDWHLIADFRSLAGAKGRIEGTGSSYRASEGGG